MATYRTIAATETDPQAPITSALMKALDGNVAAAFEGDPTAVAAGITLRDAALDTGPATGAGIGWVALRVAGRSTGDVGSYALLRFAAGTTAAAGSTHAGSGLRYANAEGRTGGTPAGTWRIMGITENIAPNSEITSLFLRIS